MKKIAAVFFFIR